MPGCPRMVDNYGRFHLAPVYALLAIKWYLIVLNVFLRPAPGEAAVTLREERLARARRDLAAGALPLVGV